MGICARGLVDIHGTGARGFGGTSACGSCKGRIEFALRPVGLHKRLSQSRQVIIRKIAALKPLAVLLWQLGILAVKARCVLVLKLQEATIPHIVNNGQADFPRCLLGLAADALLDAVL
jgi:hypothetical protein